MEVYDDIAISSRIRFARNVRDAKFFTKIDEFDARKITADVRDVLSRFDLFNFLSLDTLSLSECNSLFEQHLISKELIANKDISSVAISEDEKVIIMINEEDHIREQCICEGFNLLKPYRRLKIIDEALIGDLDIAYDDEFGFITASPANLGSAMRASVMLFLPALERSGQIGGVFKRAKENGLTMRGIYGEGSASNTSFYQISNQGSLGKTEEEIIDEVGQTVYDICAEEKERRDALALNERTELHDEALRAYGILSNCFVLGESEMMTLLSKVKFGASLGFLEIADEDKFQKLYYEGASGSLKEIFGFSDEKKENINRARYISKKIKNLVKRR